MAWTSDHVGLLDGPTLPRPVVELALDLEARGIRLVAHGEKLRATGDDGRPDLSEDEKATITKYKQHLIALVDYCNVDHGLHLRETV